MNRRRLSPDEEALWGALARTVRPLHKATKRLVLPATAPKTTAAVVTPAPPAPQQKAPPARSPVATLDSGWEKRIRSGSILPDMSIDLHGHSLAAAHGRLNQAIAMALARDARVLLVVTGKPPRVQSAVGAARRGAIRAEIGHWLDSSPYADRIASVRVAHPRHGGDGALYVILRRKK